MIIRLGLEFSTPEPKRDSVEERALKVVINFIRPMMPGFMIDEHDAPVVQFNSATCQSLSDLIEAALREAKAGQI